MRNRMSRIKLVLLLSACFIISAGTLMAQSEKLVVFVSILPQKYFAEKLLGSNGEINVLIDAGQSPHTYEPLPQQMGKLSRADIFFTVGVPFETALKSKICSLCPDLKIYDTDANIEKRIMLEEHYHEEGGHYEEKGHNSEEHHHGVGEKDPHFWLDPLKASQMAENMAKAIVCVRPELKDSVSNNLENIKTDMNALVDSLSAVLAGYKGKTMLVFHPAFGYFADRFGLIQKSVEIEGKEPTPKQLSNLIKDCNSQGVKTIFVQKQFPASIAKTIADSIGGKVVAIDPLAENYIENLKSMAGSIAGTSN